MKHCEVQEEGTRNVVAECMGKLTLLDPPGLLPKLKGHLRVESALTRSTVVTAVKFTISDQVSGHQMGVVRRGRTQVGAGRGRVGSEG